MQLKKLPTQQQRVESFSLLPVNRFNSESNATIAARLIFTALDSIKLEYIKCAKIRIYAQKKYR